MLQIEFYTYSTRMRHAKQLEVHGQLHALLGCSMKVVTLSGGDVCEKTWRHIFAISKRHSTNTVQNSSAAYVHVTMEI